MADQITQFSEDPTLSLAQELVLAESISPVDAGCQKKISNVLAGLGFTVESLPFEDVENLWACHGEAEPYFVLAGHTDVVPPGPLDEWHYPPFEPIISDGFLHGRGAADMKGSLAAMITATDAFLRRYPNHKGTLAYLITSDEEADAVNGTRRVLEELLSRGIHLSWCLIGEPTSHQQLGDVIRVGRRGSLHANLKLRGIQGHVAYPNKANNPIHRALPALDELVKEVWDQGNEFFPPTSMQISNIHAGTGITNVIPGELDLLINFRFSNELTDDGIRNRFTEILDKHELDYEVTWTLSGNPFSTIGGELIAATQKTLKDQLKIDTELSTSGGTSDGRFIAPTGTQVVELGPCNWTIHKVNEKVACDELLQLRLVYQQIIEELLT